MIRAATVADAEAIAAVHHRAWHRAYADLLSPEALAFQDLGERTQKWREWLDSGGGQTWLAEVEARVAGFVAVRGAEVRSIYVDPPAQGAGIGRALLAQAEVVGARELEVWAGNGHGRRFYESCGWRDAGAAGEWLDRPLRRYVR